MKSLHLLLLLAIWALTGCGSPRMTRASSAPPPADIAASSPNAGPVVPEGSQTPPPAQNIAPKKFKSANLQRGHASPAAPRLKSAPPANPAPRLAESPSSLSPGAARLNSPRPAKNTVPKFDPRANPQQLATLTLTNFISVSPTNRINPDWLAPSTEPFTVGPGDVLDIELLGQEGRTTAVVGPDGKIYFFLLPGLDVWGLTLTQTKHLLERELLKFLRNPDPQISITLRQVGSKRVWILGRVHAPGVYTLSVPITLLEAITMAGGPIAVGDTELASFQDSFLMRRGELIPIDFQRLLRGGDLSQNIYLQADDFIYLPASYTQEVYVLGNVRQPSPILYRQEMTLLSALTAAGGPSAGAALSHVAIVRGSLSDPKIAIVNYRDIERGRATDVLLEPRDIVYVPSSPFNILGRYAMTIVTTFIRTVAINEGVRAVVRDQEPARVQVPIE